MDKNFADDNRSTAGRVVRGGRSGALLALAPRAVGMAARAHATWPGLALRQCDGFDSIVKIPEIQLCVRNAEPGSPPSGPPARCPPPRSEGGGCERSIMYCERIFHGAQQFPHCEVSGVFFAVFA